MAQEQFDILVSTSDFLKMQARCHDLQLQHAEITKQKNQLNTKLIEVQQENWDLIKKISSLEDNIKYISLQSIKLAQSVMHKDEQFENLKTSLTLNASQYDLKYSESIREQRQLQLRISKAQSQHLNTVQQLTSKIKLLTQEVQKIQGEIQKEKHKNRNAIQSNEKYQKEMKAKTQKLNNQLNKLKEYYANEQQKNKKLVEAQERIEKEIQKKVQSLNIQLAKTKESKITQESIYKSMTLNRQKILKQKQQIANLNKQHKIIIDSLKKQISNLKSGEQKLKQLIKDKNAECQSLKREKEESSIHSDELQQWKLYGQIKMEKLQNAEAQLRQKEDLIKGQQLQIKQLSKMIKQKQEMLKDADLIIKDLELKSSNNKKDNQRDIRILIEQYFFNFGIGLYDAGDMEPGQINRVLRSQENIMKTYIEDAVRPMLQDEKVHREYYEEKKANGCFRFNKKN